MAQKGITSKVTKTSWCVQAPASSSNPGATPTPSASASPSKKAKASSSPSASASPAAAYAKLDVSGAQPLPCGFASKQATQTALAAYTTPHVTTQYCVFSSQNQNLGCYTTQSAAAQRQRETGIQSILDLIGKTARLEERPTLQVVAPTDPSYASIQLTCSTPQEQATKDCQGAAQDNNDVWYLSQAAGSAPGSKMHLGPVVIIGSNITKASAQLTGGGTQNLSVPEWAVAFTLDGGNWKDGRITLGGVSPVPYRAKVVEDALKGKDIKATAKAAAAQIRTVARPMSLNAYKVDLAAGLIERTLLEAMG